MRIFIDIGHPAHVHYFKNFIKIMTENGHSFFISARNKEMTHHLLQYLGIDYFNRGKGRVTAIGKLMYLVYADIAILRKSLFFKPDIFLGFASFYTAHVAKILRKPSIILDDTENGKLQQLFYKPFASLILSPDCFYKNFGENHIKFPSYMELSYLHPKYFTPDIDVLGELGVQKDDCYTFCRFVSWNANHDFGHEGLSLKNKILAVKEFSKFGKVFISSEIKLPKELEKYMVTVSPEKIHSVLYYASLVFGESATMASESAILGTNSIYIDNEGRGYTDQLESKYNLVHNFTESNKDQIASINKGIHILSDRNLRMKSQKSKNMILSDKINLTDYLVWLIENYPKSSDLLKKKLKTKKDLDNFVFEKYD